MEVAAVLYFLKNGVKLHFYSLGTFFEENIRVSRGARVAGGDLKMQRILKRLTELAGESSSFERTKQESDSAIMIS